jgi:hypothetical protein
MILCVLGQDRKAGSHDTMCDRARHEGGPAFMSCPNTQSIMTSRFPVLPKTGRREVMIVCVLGQDRKAGSHDTLCVRARQESG